MTMTLEGQQYFMLYLTHNKIQSMLSTDNDVGHYNIIRMTLLATNSDIHIAIKDLNTPHT
jgi:hypothetical protein